MNQEEARNFMKKVMLDLKKRSVRSNMDTMYIRGQIVGMIKAFKKMGVIPKDDPNGILEEMLDMI